MTGRAGNWNQPACRQGKARYMCFDAKDVGFVLLAAVGFAISLGLIVNHDGRSRVGPFRNYWAAESYSGKGRLIYYAWLGYALVLPILFFAVLPRLVGEVCF